MSTIAETIFPNSTLPKWDAIRCFELFMVHRDRKPTLQERDEFANQVLHKVCLSVAQHGLLRVLDAGSGADEVVNRITEFICSRVDRFNLRKPWGSLSPDEGSRAMISSFNTAIYRKMAEEIESTKRDRKQKMANPNDAAEALDSIPAPAGNIGPEFERLAEKLSDEETLEVLLRSYPFNDILMGESILLQQQSALLTRGELLGFDELDESLQAKCTPEAHALVTTRLTRFVHDYAANLN